MTRRLTPPLASDSAREAIDSLRGYLYQLWQSLHAWLTLREGEVLFLEGAEDADLLRGTEATTIQMRDQVRPISLGSASIREAVGHFWRHRIRNSDRHVRYRYLTTAAITTERPDIGLKRAGLLLWGDAQRSNKRDEWGPIVSAITARLLADNSLDSDLRSFLESATIESVYSDLIRPISWDTDAPNQQAVAKNVGRAVAAYGRTRKLTSPQSRAAIPLLLQHVGQTAIQRDDRYLTREDFIDLFEEATSISVSVNAVSALLGDDLQTVLEPAGQLPPRYHRREAVLQRLDDIVRGGGIAVIIGSSGVGKTSLAVDYADRSTAMCFRLDVRGRAPVEVDHLLRLALRAWPSGGAWLLVDDLETNADVRRYTPMLRRLANHVRNAGGAVLMTSYGLPPRLLRETLAAPEGAYYRIPMFDEDDIRSYLFARGAPNEVIAPWARFIIASTGGHPTLVAARVAAAERQGFPALTEAQLLERPIEVRDVDADIESFVRDIKDGPRRLLYRASVGLRHPLKRQHLIALAEADFPGEGPVQPAGEALAELLGPWLERSPRGRFRLTPLVDRCGEHANGPGWMKNAHRVMAAALLVDKEPDIADAAFAVIHALSGEDTTTLLALLEGFIQNHEDEFWYALNAVAPWFTAIALRTEHKVMENVAVVSTMRSAQYRAASAASDNRTATRIVQAFKSEVPLDDYHAPLRFVFYSVACVYAAEAISRRVENTVAWLNAAEASLRSGVPFAAQMVSSFKSLPDTGGDIAAAAGVLLFGAIHSVKDLDDFVTACQEVATPLILRLVASVIDAPVVWRGAVIGVIVDTFDAEIPDFAAVARALDRFELFAQGVNALPLAVEAAASRIRVLAEFGDDIEGAEIALSRSLERYGEASRLKVAGAAIAHARGDALGAVRLFREAIDLNSYTEDDLEPVLDLRVAAIDAALTGRDDIASDFLAEASDRVSATNSPVLRMATRFDAAYAAWRTGNDERAFALAEQATEELIARAPTLRAETVRNLTRRVGHVSWPMAQSTFARAAQSTLPRVGYASDSALLIDDATTAPELIMVSVASLEARVNSSGAFFARNRSKLLAAPFPMGGLAYHIAACWDMRRGDAVQVLADLLAHFLETRAAIVANGGVLPDEEPPIIDLVAAALLAATMNGSDIAVELTGIVNAAERPELRLIRRWAETGLDYVGDSARACEALAGRVTDYRLQLLGALIVGMSNDATPVALLRSQSIWIDNLTRFEPLYPTGPLLHTVISQTWMKMLQRRPALVTGLSSVLNPVPPEGWESAIPHILRAAADIVGHTLSERTQATLAALHSR